MKKITSKYIGQEKLLVSKNTTVHFFEIIFYMAVFGFWVITILKQYNSNEFKDHSLVMICFFLLIPLLMIPNFIKSIRVFIDGEDYIFDSYRKEITRNKKRIAYFNDIDFIQIRTFYDSDNGNSYRLSLALKSNSKIRIEESSDYEIITSVAEDMADVLQVQVRNK